METEGKSNRKDQKDRLLKSVFLALFVFIAFSYNLRLLPDPDSLSLYEQVRVRLATYGFPGNLYVAGLTALFWLWFRRFDDHALFSSRPLTVTACLFGLLNECALFLFYRNMLPRGSVTAIAVFLFQAAAWVILFLFCSRAVLLLLKTIGEQSGKEQRPLSGFPAFLEKHVFLSAFLIILIGWLPWVISYYPASIEWDVYYPIMQWLGYEKATNHHPWFYAMIVGSFWQWGNNLGDKDIGMFLYIVIRDLCLAALYARCILMEKKSGLPRAVWITAMLFFAFTPVWGAYAKHAFKDTIGAGLFCWFIHLLIDILQRIRSGKLHGANCLEYAAAMLLGCLFRNNTIYVTAPITILLIVLCLKKKQGLKAAFALFLGILLFLTWEGCVFNVLKVERGSAREMLSLPFQQTARTVKLHVGELTDEERAVLRLYWEDEKDLTWRYDPLISDPVKDADLKAAKSLGEYWDYLKLWWKMGWKYPYTYLEALIAHSSGYYAFTPEFTDEQSYGSGNYANVGMAIFNWAKDPRFPDWLTCSNPPELAGIENALDQWAEVWHQIPILNLTDMKPMYTWVILLMGGMMIKRREYDKLLPIGACMLMILTCIASPVNDCFRYFAPVAAAFPGLFMLLPKNRVEC